MSDNIAELIEALKATVAEEEESMVNNVEEEDPTPEVPARVSTPPFHESMIQSAEGKPLRVVPAEPPNEKQVMIAYLQQEEQNLSERQRVLQEQLQNKNREIQTIRETMLVVSGALQAIQHVSGHVRTAL